MSHSHRPEGENALLMRGQRRRAQANSGNKVVLSATTKKRHLRINIPVKHSRFHFFYPTSGLGITSLNRGISESQGLLRPGPLISKPIICLNLSQNYPEIYKYTKFRKNGFGNPIIPRSQIKLCFGVFKTLRWRWGEFWCYKSEWSRSHWNGFTLNPCLHIKVRQGMPKQFTVHSTLKNSQL